MLGCKRERIFYVSTIVWRAFWLSELLDKLMIKLAFEGECVRPCGVGRPVKGRAPDLLILIL